MDKKLDLRVFSDSVAEDDDKKFIREHIKRCGASATAEDVAASVLSFGKTLREVDPWAFLVSRIQLIQIQMLNESPGKSLKPQLLDLFPDTTADRGAVAAKSPSKMEEFNSILLEDTNKGVKELSPHENQQRQLILNEENEKIDFEERMKEKKVTISDVLITLSKAERREARLKAQNDTLRLGKAAAMRTGFNMSEGWEDGPAFKNVNDGLVLLSERKEKLHMLREHLRKRPPDKGDILDEETRVRPCHSSWGIRLLTSQHCA